MRQRLRATPTPDELAELYGKPFDHTRWGDHVYRIDVLAAIGRHQVPEGGLVVDLSCGDGALARRIAEASNGRAILGDYVPGYAHTGPIEETIRQLPARVDLFVCTETLEHVDDPDAVLRAIRPKATRILVSTPDGEVSTRNPEHVWGWDADAIRRMLVAAGFTPEIYSTLDLRPAGGEYNFQIWLCR